MGKWEGVGSNENDYDHYTFEESGKFTYEGVREDGATGLRVLGSGTWSYDGDALRIVEVASRTEYYKNGQHDRTREASQLGDYTVKIKWVGGDHFILDYEGQADEAYQRIEERRAARKRGPWS